MNPKASGTRFETKAKDGYDTIEWAAKQPWSNGKVGLEGGSYLGHVQWRAATQSPPSLVTMFPAVASTNIYKNWLTHGGAFRLVVQLWLGCGAHAESHHASAVLAHREASRRRS